MHSYGYNQANLDFGNVRRHLEHGEMRRVNYLSILGTDEYLKETMNIEINLPAQMSELKGLNKLIYRYYCPIRVNKMVINQQTDIKNTLDKY